MNLKKDLYQNKNKKLNRTTFLSLYLKGIYFSLEHNEFKWSYTKNYLWKTRAFPQNSVFFQFKIEKYNMQRRESKLF